MLTAGDLTSTLPVSYSDGHTVDAVLSADLTGIAAKGTLPQVEIDLPDTLQAPVYAGQIIGTARLTAGGIIIAEVPIISATDIARDDFPARWLMYWQNWLGTPHT